ncbi:hypothetical protein CHUAL_007834 [Chamberlinius hualienensis]
MADGNFELLILSHLSTSSIIDNSTMLMMDNFEDDGDGIKLEESSVTSQHTIIPNVTPSSPSASPSNSNYSNLLTAQVQIPLYSAIFLLAVIGNVLVIVTLVQNKRMRTITNVHLLNLAISDLLLGVFCMPFTLVGMLLKDFIFGELMCKLIPYLQAVSVAVSAWTLVAISVERYYAICHPLFSLRWQTRSHAHRIIGIVWAGSLISMIPIAILSVLQPVGNTGRSKCREEWPSQFSEKAFNIFLDVVLLVIPLLIMVTTYSLIIATLWKGIKKDDKSRNCTAKEAVLCDKELQRAARFTNGNTIHRSCSSSEEIFPPGSSFRSTGTVDTDSISGTDSTGALLHPNSSHHPHPRSPHSYSHPGTPLRISSRLSSPALQSSTTNNLSSVPTCFQVRHTHVEVSRANKKRVIKMLFVVVLEFFICWTPLYVINTLSLFRPKMVYQDLGYMAISFFQLIAYASSCCNPITYCFMNSKFKRAFLSAFGCNKASWMITGTSSTSNSAATTTFQMSVRK